MTLLIFNRLLKRHIILYALIVANVVVYGIWVFVETQKEPKIRCIIIWSVFSFNENICSCSLFCGIL